MGNECSRESSNTFPSPSLCLSKTDRAAPNPAQCRRITSGLPKKDIRKISKVPMRKAIVLDKKRGIQKTDRKEKKVENDRPIVMPVIELEPI